MVVVHIFQSIIASIIFILTSFLLDHALITFPRCPYFKVTCIASPIPASTMSLSSTPLSIAPSAAEIKDGQLSQRNLEVAIRAISRDGLVVIEDLIPHEVLDKLNEKMVQDAYELQARKDSPFNYNKGNIQQDPPLTGEWFSNEIFLSKHHLFDIPSSRSVPDHSPSISFNL
jgi:hypothetical protein